MEKLVIHGGRTLSGNIQVSGSKNATLPIMTAAILTNDDDGPVAASIIALSPRNPLCAAAVATVARTREIVGWERYAIVLQQVEDGCGQ